MILSQMLTLANIGAEGNTSIQPTRKETAALFPLKLFFFIRIILTKKQIRNQHVPWGPSGRPIVQEQSMHQMKQCEQPKSSRF